jgi:hypothetical protein
MAVKVERWTNRYPSAWTPFKPLYPLGDLEAAQTRCFHIGGKVPSEGMALLLLIITLMTHIAGGKGLFLV